MPFFKVLFSFCLTSQVLAMDLNCEASRQKPNQKLEQIHIALIESSPRGLKFSGLIEEFKFDAEWDLRLDSLYVKVLQNQKTLLFATLRVPTELHNDSYTEVYLSEGSRLAVSCTMKFK